MTGLVGYCSVGDVENLISAQRLNNHSFGRENTKTTFKLCTRASIRLTYYMSGYQCKRPLPKVTLRLPCARALFQL